MDLSIVIVSYNTKKLTQQTLQSIYDKRYNFPFEIFVVDNASTDGSVQMVMKEFPMVKVIESGGNLGFSKANNLALKQVAGKYILLLNSDTVVVDDCLEKTLNYIKANNDIGVLGCKVMLPNGQLDHACKRGFPTPEASLYYMIKLNKVFPNVKRFGQYDLTYISENEIHDVDSVMGAFMLMSKKAIDEVGLLDEEFFMYGEDIDWCYRFKKAGWRVVYYPMGKIIHYKGGSSKKKRNKLIYEFHRAMYLFYRKHYKTQYPLWVTTLVYLGIGGKLILSLLINLFRRRR